MLVLNAPIFRIKNFLKLKWACICQVVHLMLPPDHVFNFFDMSLTSCYLEVHFLIKYRCSRASISIFHLFVSVPRLLVKNSYCF